jgi:hypothetical protein
MKKTALNHGSQIHLLILQESGFIPKNLRVKRVLDTFAVSDAINAGSLPMHFLTTSKDARNVRLCVVHNISGKISQKKKEFII